MIAAHYMISCRSVLVGDSVEQRKLIVWSGSDSWSKCKPRISPELLHTEVYIAVDSVIGRDRARQEAPRYDKYGHRVPW